MENIQDRYYSIDRRPSVEEVLEDTNTFQEPDPSGAATTTSDVYLTYRFLEVLVKEKNSSKSGSTKWVTHQ